MTTNITPIEALEKILKARESRDRLEYKSLAEYMEAIATQALAPQECDMTECPYARICENKDKDGNIQVVCCLRQIDIRQSNNRIDMGCKICKNNPNCYYKQLHPQEKTFTVKEQK